MPSSLTILNKHHKRSFNISQDWEGCVCQRPVWLLLLLIQPSELSYRVITLTGGLSTAAPRLLHAPGSPVKLTQVPSLTHKELKF